MGDKYGAATSLRSCCVVLGDQDGWGINRLSKAESILGTGMSQNLSRGRRHTCVISCLVPAVSTDDVYTDYPLFLLSCSWAAKSPFLCCPGGGSRVRAFGWLFLCAYTQRPLAGFALLATALFVFPQPFFLCLCGIRRIDNIGGKFFDISLRSLGCYAYTIVL